MKMEIANMYTEMEIENSLMNDKTELMLYIENDWGNVEGKTKNDIMETIKVEYDNEFPNNDIDIIATLENLLTEKRLVLTE